MAVDLLKAGVAVGVGALDEVMNSWDEKQGRTKSFRTATDLSRLAVAGAGYAIMAFYPRQSRIGEVLALSGTTLLTKSVAKPLRSAIGGGTVTTSSYVPRMAVPVSPKHSPIRIPNNIFFILIPLLYDFKRITHKLKRKENK